MNRRSFFALIGLGAVAQMAEHLPRKQTVFGSIPNGTSIDPETVASTMDIPNWGALPDSMMNIPDWAEEMMRHLKKHPDATFQLKKRRNGADVGLV